MKVHKETIDVLTALYENAHQILGEMEDTSMDAEQAQEAAAIDYMMSDEHAQFCNLVDNLDDEVCRELIALMKLGRDGEKYSASDFDRLKNEAREGTESEETLFGQPRLSEWWKAGLDIMGMP